MAKLGTRALTLSVGGDDMTAQITNCRITAGAADSDTVTFADAAAGGARLYKLEGSAIQDPAVDTMWDIVWTAPGTSVATVVKPNGGTTASPTQPHFTGNNIVAEPDGDLLGGEANVSATAKFKFDFAWEYTAKPVRVTS